MLFDSLNRSLAFLSRLFDPHHPTRTFYELPQGKPDCPTGPLPAPLPRAVPEEVGISCTELSSFIRALADDPELNMHNVTVARKGKIVLDFSFRGYDVGIWKYTFSACKSVTSLAVGILVGMGKLRVSDRVSDYIPDDLLNPILRLKMRDLTVEHLLTMTSGVSFNELGSLTESDWLKAFLAGIQGGEAGKKFVYNSMNTYMLAWLVCHISGQTLSAFLKENLFDPLGITRYYWETDAQGVEKGGWGLYIAPEEMIRLGMLILRNGEWNGRQIVPAEYLAAATKAQRTAPEEYGDFNYGYQMWVGRERNTVLFNGMLGQNLLIDRENGIVLMTNAGNAEMFQQGRYFAYARQYFAHPFADVLPRDPDSERMLSETLASVRPHREPEKKKTIGTFLKEAFAKKKEDDPLAPFCGKRFLSDDRDAEGVGLFPYLFQTVHNLYSQGLVSISVEMREGVPVLVYEEKTVTYRLRLGKDVPILGSAAYGKETYLVGASYKVRRDEEDRDVLVIRLDFPETPHSRILKLRVGKNGEGILEQEELPGSDFLYDCFVDIKDGLETQPVIGGAIRQIDDDYLRFVIDRCFSPKINLK